MEMANINNRFFFTTNSKLRIENMIVKQCSFILLLNCMPFVILFNYQKPVAEKLWRERCVRNALVLNDCNWCWCTENFRYACNAKVCGEVDMFGHFNDAIQNINVGMEGHGYWRTTAAACEPGVHYTRGDLLCVCTQGGTWPNPVCRDTFRVLHPVEVLKSFELSKYQKCSPTKLYLADCNVCFCPPSGQIDPSLCTQNKCTDDNLISTRSEETQVDEVYAECNMDQKYKLGCKNCVCLRNNRLLCDNCTKDSQCANRKSGENFNVECNTCHCDAQGTIYCTINRCLHSHEEIEVLKWSNDKARIARKQLEDIDCEPGTRFMKNCNTCYCFQKRGKIKKYGCTVNKCHEGDTIHDCEIGDAFNKDCLLCHCGMFNDLKMEICQSDPKCFKNKNRVLRKPEYDVKEYRQECKPLHVYKNGCSTCQCSSDGKTLSCTDEDCNSKPISLNIIPVVQKISHCPKGHFYQIDCNYCICIANGNAVCTTMECKNKIK